MKVFLFTAAGLLNSVADSALVSGRKLHWGDGVHLNEGRLANLQEMVESKCNSDFTCPESISGCDSTIEKPERPTTSLWEMSDEERVEAKAEMKVKVDMFKQQVLVCACCDGKTLKELVDFDRMYDGSESSSLDEEGFEFESSSSSEDQDSTGDVITEDTDLSTLPEQSISIARASAAVGGVDAHASNPACQVSISWTLIFAAAAGGITGLTL